MRIVSIGDLVTDYYYKNGKLIGLNGGMTSHNIIANLAKLKMNTVVFGVCGEDMPGKISILSLDKLGVDISNVKINKDIKTRCFHVSYLDKEGKLTFSSKKRCPLCNNKKWYEESMIDTDEILSKLELDDILVFDNLNNKNQIIIDNCLNKKMLDLGQCFELDNYTNDEIINKIKSKFELINLNERVEKYLIDRFNLNNNKELFDLLLPKMIIVTRGNKGAEFIIKDKSVFKKLQKVSEEVDSTGAGDAFFSIFIYYYIKNNYIIDNEYIENAFIKATKLTSKVVKSFGARGHLNILYKVKSTNQTCTCEDFVIPTRKQIKRCNININNLETRIINAINSSAYDKIKKMDFDNINNALFIGTGGSLAGANYSSKVINCLYGINTVCLLPREVSYRNNKLIDKVFLFSYSGTTNDLIEGTKSIDNNKKYLITKGEVQKIVKKTAINKNNIISYRTNSNKGKEKGFLSFEGALAPASIFLKMYLELTDANINLVDFIKDSLNYWDDYFNKLFKDNKKNLLKILAIGNNINIFTGDYTTSACIDLESKLIESGTFNILLHEKKNFSHGRFINYEHLNSKYSIYFKQKEISDYENKLLDYLDKENTLIIESRFNDILCEYDLLVASQYLAYYISNLLGIDISKPTYSEAAMKIYFYKGQL